MFQGRDSLWNAAPPPAQDRAGRYPTLLFSWWCTCFAATIIATRLIGRKVRSNVLFKEDWFMLASMVPLFIRMGLIHPVLLFGTNNVESAGAHLTPHDIERREHGSQLVLAARIFYAMFIWTSKLTVSEFLKRITIRIWRKKYERTLHFIRVFLGVTFVAVIIATLAECRPFNHYWQVVPEVDAQCRTGYANLLTMGIADIITDILLVVFPIPIVLSSGRTWRRQLSTILLFSTSIALIIVTAIRMPAVIAHRGRQQYRTVWASCEILASAAVSNFVIIGSFLRDKGTKRQKFKSYSATDSIDRASTRRPTLSTLQQIGSDEDLFRSFNGKIPSHLLGHSDSETTVKPASTVLPAEDMPFTAPSDEPAVAESSEPDGSPHSSDSEVSSRGRAKHEPLPSPAPSKKAVSFFDVGGLLEDGTPTPQSRSRASTGVKSLSAQSSTVAHDFATPTSSPNQSRRGSRSLLSDLGGLLSPVVSRGEGSAHSPNRKETNGNAAAGGKRRSSLAHNSHLSSMPERRESEQEPEHELQDMNTDTDTPPHHPRPHILGLAEALQKPAHDFDAFAAPGEPERTWAQPILPRVSTTSTLESRSGLSRPGTQQSLQDIGGLLAPAHEPDASAAALQRATAAKRTITPARHSPSPSPHKAADDIRAGAERPRVAREMSLQDAGGLLGSS